MRRHSLVLGLSLACLAVPGLALADEPEGTPTQPPPSVTESTAATIDSVYLRSGGMFRGRVTEIVPGSHVQIKLENGEAKRLPWTDVDRVIVASTSVPPPPNATKLGTEPPRVGPMARVHLNAGSHQAFLVRQPAGTTDWISACESPCDQLMPLGDTYKVAGTGFRTTKEFKLDAEPGGAVELSVDGPNWLGIIGGGALTLTGAGMAYGGLLVAAAGSSCDGSYYNRCDGTGSTGLVVAAVGAGLIALGLVIVYPSLRTDLEQQRDKPAKDAFVRAPSWRTATATEQGLPVTLPFSFSRSF